jgi:hypothetical protein
MISPQHHNKTFAQADKIITFFHRSPLRHASLREQQKKVYVKHRSSLALAMPGGRQRTMLHLKARELSTSGQVRMSWMTILIIDTTFRFRREDLL